MKHLIIAIAIVSAACGSGYAHPMDQGMFRVDTACNQQRVQCARQMMRVCPNGVVNLNKGGTIFMCRDEGGF